MVRPRRCTRGLVLLDVLLFAAAFVLDDMAVLFGAAVLLCGIAGAWLIFDRRFRAAVESVRVEREPERSQVRKGTTLAVATTVTVTVPRGLALAIREQFSHHVAVQDGTASCTADYAPAPVVQRMTYRLTAMVHGEYRFPGLVLSARDLFFGDEIFLSSAAYAGPYLNIQPTGLFEPGQRRITAETREVEKMSVLSGFSIRALREYYAGDDMRKIDWKQSAKHDKIFVREYTGVMNIPPLVIVDLPWRGDPYVPAEFERMVAAVAGIVEHSVRTYQYASVLVISGPNILAFVDEEKDLERCMTVLRKWMHPAERPSHLYRFADRSDLRSEVRRIDAVLPDVREPANERYLTLLRRVYQAGLRDQRAPVFTGQIVRTISSITVDEIQIFSLGIGDTSHLRQIVRQARTMKILTHVRLPARLGSRGIFRDTLGADTVEAFA